MSQEEQINISMRASIDFSLAGIKALLIVNGGAVIAILSFIGNSEPKYFRHDLVASGLNYFIYGLISALIVVLFSYLAQEHTTQSLNKRFAYLRAIAVVAAISSTFCFSYGAITTASAFNIEPDTQKSSSYQKWHQQ